MALELEVNANTGGFQRGMKGASVATTAMGTAIGVLASRALPALTQTIGKAVARTGEISKLENGFKNLAKASNLSAGAILSGMRPATRGLVTDIELLKQTNNAMTLGIVRSESEWISLTASATKLGQALGLDVAHALESLTIGLGRQSKLVLDNLGIIVDTEGAYKDYAEALGVTVSELSDAEKKTAFLDAAMEKIAITANRAGEAHMTLADQLTVLRVNADNLLTAWAKWINSLESGNAFMAEMDKATRAGEGSVEDFVAALTSSDKSWGTWIGAMWEAKMATLGFSTDLSNMSEIAEESTSILTDHERIILNIEPAYNAASFAFRDLEGVMVSFATGLPSTVPNLFGDMKTKIEETNSPITMYRDLFEDVLFQSLSYPKQQELISLAYERMQVAIANTSARLQEYLGFMSAAGNLGTIGLGDVDAEFDTSLPGSAPGKGGIFGKLFGMLGGGGGGGIGGLLGGLFGGGGGGFGIQNILGGLLGGATGGGGFGSIFSGLLGGGLSSFLGPLGGLVSTGITKLGGLIFGGFKKLFGGPSAAELGARGIADQFRKSMTMILSDQQKAEAGGVEWKETNIAVRDAYEAIGLTSDQAFADIERLNGAMTEEEAAQAVAIIGDNFIRLQEEMDRTGLTMEELKGKTQGELAAIAAAANDARDDIQGLGDPVDMNIEFDGDDIRDKLEDEITGGGPVHVALESEDFFERFRIALRNTMEEAFEDFVI